MTDYPAEIVNHALPYLKGDATIRAYRRTDYLPRPSDGGGSWRRGRTT